MVSFMKILIIVASSSLSKISAKGRLCRKYLRVHGRCINILGNVLCVTSQLWNILLSPVFYSPFSPSPFPFHSPAWAQTDSLISPSVPRTCTRMNREFQKTWNLISLLICVLIKVWVKRLNKKWEALRFFIYLFSLEAFILC